MADTNIELMAVSNSPAKGYNVYVKMSECVLSSKQTYPPCFMDPIVTKHMIAQCSTSINIRQ